MAKSWADVKALLDDPSVPPDSKTMLINSWLHENPPNPQDPETAVEDHQDAQRYATAYGGPAGFVPIGGSTDDAYTAAKQTGDQADYNENQETKAVTDGKSQLDDKQPPASNQVGTKTSDELFDAAAPALKVFQTFGSLLAKIPDDCRGNTRALDFDKDIQQPFDQQRGIQFQQFMDDADHFHTGSTTVDQTIQDTGSALNSLMQTWTGDAANAAWDKNNNDIQPKATKLSQTLSGASQAVTTTVTTVFQLCKGKADAIIAMYTDQVGKADFTMAQKVISVANGEHGSVDDLAAIAGWMDLNFGTNLVKTLNDDGCCDDKEIQSHGKDLAKQWVQNQFNPDMWDRLYEGFVKTCKDTHDLVDQAYDTLDGVMSKVRNEFGGTTTSGGTGSGGPSSNTPPATPGNGGPPPSGSVPPVPGSTPPSGSTLGGPGGGGGSPQVPVSAPPSGGNPGGGSPASIPPIPDSTPPSGTGGGSPGSIPPIPGSTSPSGTGGGSPGSIPPIPGSTPPSGTGGGSPGSIPPIPGSTSPSGDLGPTGTGGSGSGAPLGGIPPMGGPGSGSKPGGTLPSSIPPLGPTSGNPAGSGPLGRPGGIGGPGPAMSPTGDPLGATGDRPETLTVKQGDKTFEMTAPGPDGHMDIKIGDGTSPDKDFKLDWAKDTAATGAQPGSPSDFGPQGSPGHAGADKAGQPGADGAYHPGPDGKIHFTDGDTKITAERPDGPAGPTVVTVDDGKGTPTTYTLGEAAGPGSQTPVDVHSGIGSGHLPSSAPVPHDVSHHTEPSTAGLSHAALGGGAGGGVPAGPLHGSIGHSSLIGAATPAEVGAGAHSGAAAGLAQSPAGFQPVMTAAAGDPSSGQPVGGMQGMGAMGGGGAHGGGGGGGGGDQERGPRGYRVDGGLFETVGDPAGHRISGSLDDDDDQPPLPRRR
jgi:uncharacterized protein YukE